MRRFLAKAKNGLVTEDTEEIKGDGIAWFPLGVANQRLTE
jgi:hypothetical protein